MAVHCNLSTLMGKKRYTIQDVHENTGLSRNTVSKLYSDKATRIDYDTIEKLCKLFDCTPNELFDVNTLDGGQNN
ncbi:helix-turn-helix domain-containing protein [Pseudobutyrivibrio sp.]|jgi:putative transcriptional regulator|uniref:helix-turn-helix domain-containing protein n=1 Tax=Pseudobutyrivibrio sp. TaxID=2014367 RepID=UPI0025F0A676|nr:helix-turn-helix transcriptional regulator [Pseudobutyrivibrio sp.]MBE5844470.1 helix-turn-helix transcriptional regulator [Butyrivibrio sp.]